MDKIKQCIPEIVFVIGLALALGLAFNAGFIQGRKYEIKRIEEHTDAFIEQILNKLGFKTKINPK